MNSSKRNRNAGKFIGKSKSSKYFAENEEARKKKNAYSKKYNSTPKEKKNRALLNKENKERGTYGNGDNKDVSHKKNGKTFLEHYSSNRARNGKNGKTTKK